MTNPPHTAPERDRHPRLSALGDELVEIHDHLRRLLAAVREQAVRPGAARGEDHPAAAGAALRAHCLAFCSALTTHHTGEDAGAFPALVRDVPDLAPTVAKLEQDHAMMSGLLAQVAGVAEQLADAPRPAERERLVRHLDGLVAICDSHFAFEERTIVGALNALPAGTSPAALFGDPDPRDTEPPGSA